MSIFTSLSSAVFAASCDNAVSFVESYYADLTNNDADSALAKWKEPPKGLRKAVENIQSADVNRSTLKSCDSDDGKANIYVEVTVKAYKKKAEDWVGTVKLQSVRDDWKIVALNLSQK